MNIHTITAIKTSAATLIATSLFAINAHAAPSLIVAPITTNSSTIVEQSADGQIATITSTPNSITMQNGLPYYATQVTTVPRYTVRQNGVVQTSTVSSPVVVTQSNVINAGTTVTTLPVNTIPVTNNVTSVGVVTTPVGSVVPLTPVNTTTVTALPNAKNTVTVTTTSLDTLQLKPVFSAQNMVSANTKVMKILKNKDGVEFAVPANHIAPGDIIEYHTVYTNTTGAPLTDINATVALPNGVKLVALDSALPTLATVGGNTYQTIGQAGGRIVVEQPYSGLQWNLVNLDANASQNVVIRATVQ